MKKQVLAFALLSLAVAAGGAADEQTRLAQQELSARGYYLGAVDGTHPPLTRCSNEWGWRYPGRRPAGLRGRDIRRYGGYRRQKGRCQAGLDCQRRFYPRLVGGGLRGMDLALQRRHAGHHYSK